MLVLPFMMASRFSVKPSGQATITIPSSLLLQLLKRFTRAGLEIQNLKLLAVATGPGSFTGLRIGLAVAKGIALACHLPIIGIPTLDIVAESQPVSPGLPLAAVLQAGRGRLAVGWYTANNDSLAA